MALGNADFTQLFASSLQKYEKQLADNVILTHPTLELFKENAKSSTGRGLVIPVRAAALNGTTYSDDSGDWTGNTGNTPVSNDLIGAAVFDWSKEVITPFRVKHREILQNSGPEQIVSLVEEYVKAAQADHQDFIVAEIHKSAQDYTTGSINSLDMLVSNATYDAYTDGNNSAWVPVGGINPNTSGKDYWQSTRLEIDTDTDIVAAFRTVTNEIYRASRKRPTHVICGFDVFEEFEAFLQTKGQYTNPQGSANTRFTTIQFGDLTLRLDPDCQDNRAYFLNSPSLRFAYCAGEFMKSYPAVPLEGTLDTVVPIASTLALGVAERRANGLLIRVAP
jgi:hypothetical protein